MTERLSIRAYADHLGVSHVAVIKAIRSGRLRECIVSIDGKKLIDSVIADREWFANTDHAMRRDGRVTQAPEESRHTSPPAQSIPAPPSSRGARDEIEFSIGKARAVEANIKARLLKIDLEERIGNITDAAAVNFRIAEHVRAALDILASRRRRIAPKLAIETDPRKIEIMLEESDREFAAAVADLAAHKNNEAEAA